jgi:hypothetical protein
MHFFSSFSSPVGATCLSENQAALSALSGRKQSAFPGPPLQGEKGANRASMPDSEGRFALTRPF